MSKIVWVIVLIIVAVAIYNVFTKLGSGTESISALFHIPSGGLYKISTSTSGGSYIKTGNTYTAPAPVSTNPPVVPAKPAIVPPSGFTADDLSPYYGQVKFSSVYQGSSYIPSRFSVRTNYTLSAPIDITGWSVKSNTGNLLIPGAVSDFNPSSLNQIGDIVLKSGDYVNFYSNFNPIGISFRLNVCTGYLNNTYKFNPPLPKNCPTMYKPSEIATFSGACQNLIKSLGGCSTPSADKINSVPGPNDAECRAVLNRFNYGGCYNYHRNDANFFSNEWDVWIMNQMNFDWSHDRLLLFDRNNLLVDQYIY